MVKNNSTEWLGVRFGRLVIVGFEQAPSPYRGWRWVCRCNCGKITTVVAADVKSGKTRSCGCLHDECIKQRATKFQHLVHEHKRLYSIYNGIKKRCYNPNENRYKDYGGRGIVMGNEWLNPTNGFDNFVEWSLNNGYTEEMTIERIDVNGDYRPENCKWITSKEQAFNKRDTRWVDYKGEHVQLIVLCERLGVTYDTVHDRIYKRGWSVEEAIEKPSNRTDSLMSKCRERGINYGTVRDRITKLGWSEERALNTPSKGRGANGKSY